MNSKTNSSTTKEQNYTIYYGYTDSVIFHGTLLEALTAADRGTACDGQDVVITDSLDHVMGVRMWHAGRDGIEKHANPLDYGKLGYYEDWVMAPVKD